MQIDNSCPYFIVVNSILSPHQIHLQCLNLKIKIRSTIATTPAQHQLAEDLASQNSTYEYIHRRDKKRQERQEKTSHIFFPIKLPTYRPLPSSSPFRASITAVPIRRIPPPKPPQSLTSRAVVLKPVRALIYEMSSGTLKCAGTVPNSDTIQ
jgi:hypothetical protein